ncbi:MAG: hypothetical protein Q8M07_06455 [Prosthecobacter sp.]|nr:hypothetical protein [Prosthecobacter sp.]
MGETTTTHSHETEIKKGGSEEKGCSQGQSQKTGSTEEDSECRSNKETRAQSRDTEKKEETRAPKGRQDGDTQVLGGQGHAHVSIAAFLIDLEW